MPDKKIIKNNIESNKLVVTKKGIIEMPVKDKKTLVKDKRKFIKVTEGDSQEYTNEISKMTQRKEIKYSYYSTENNLSVWHYLILAENVQPPVNDKGKTKSGV